MNNIINRNDYTVIEIKYDDINISVIWYKNNFYVPIKPVIQHIGIDWRAQARKLNDTIYCDCFNIECIYIEDIRPDDSVNNMRCISLATLDNFLKRIDPKSAPKRARERLAQYQASCAKILRKSLNSHNLKGVVSITIYNYQHFLDLIVNQQWSVRALRDLGIHPDLSSYFCFDI